MKTYRVKRTLVVEQEVQANSEKEAFEKTGGMVVKRKFFSKKHLVAELIDYDVYEVTDGQD